MKPTTIVLASVLLALGSVVLLGTTLLSGSLHHEARAALGNPIFNIGAAIFGLVCAAGIWRMKRWAVVMCVAAALLQIVLLGVTFVTELPLGIVALVAVNWSDLTW